MVDIDLDDSLSVTVSATPSDACAYTIVYDGEELTQYETSADPRTIGGQIGLRNVVCRHVPSYDKSEIEKRLAAEVSNHERALVEELGRR